MTTRPRTTPKAAPSTPPTPLDMPPLALLVARMADPGSGGELDAFAQPYARVPQLLRTMCEGDSDKYEAIEALSGLDRATARADAGETPSPKHTDRERFDYAVSLLHREDEDLVADMATPVMDASFALGMAFACFVLLEQKAGAR